MLFAELCLSRTLRTVRPRLVAALAEALPAHDVNHSLLGVLGAEYRPRAALYAVRPVLRATWTATLFIADIYHSRRGVLDAELRLSATQDPKTGALETALAGATLIDDIHHSFQRVLGAVLRLPAALDSEGTDPGATLRGASFGVDVHHPRDGVLRAAFWPLALRAVRRLPGAALMVALLAANIDHPFRRVLGAELRLFAGTCRVVGQPQATVDDTQDFRHGHHPLLGVLRAELRPPAALRAMCRDHGTPFARALLLATGCRSFVGALSELSQELRWVAAFVPVRGLARTAAIDVGLLSESLHPFVGSRVVGVASAAAFNPHEQLTLVLAARRYPY